VAEDPLAELLDQMSQVLSQAGDASTPVLSRIRSAVAVAPFLEALQRYLVDEACEAGHTWEELADVFSTSAANVRQRFGSYRSYDD